MTTLITCEEARRISSNHEKIKAGILKRIDESIRNKAIEGLNGCIFIETFPASIKSILTSNGFEVTEINEQVKQTKISW